MPSRDRNSTDYEPDDYDTFDAREDGQGRRGPILLLAAAIVLVLFLGVVWSAYNLGVRERNTAPILTADSEPWRVEPDDPGGFETPGQDIEAYGLRERDGPETVEIEPSVRPGPEEPVEEPQRPSLTVEADDIDRLDDASREGIEDVQVAAEEPSSSDIEQQAPQDSDAAIETAPAEQPRQQREPEPDDEPRPALPAASADGNFVVQIAAFRTVEEAEEAWIAYVTRFPDLSAGRRPSIVEANLGARGVYHRLRIAAFETRDDASRYCQTLSSRGQDCLVAAR